MAIIGGRVLEVKATRKKDAVFQGMGMNINFDEMSVRDKKLVVVYTAIVSYAPEIAELSVKGELVTDEKNPEKIKEVWEKEKKIEPQELAEDLLTAITYAASAVGTLLAYAIGINAPINVPRAKLGPPQKAG